MSLAPKKWNILILLIFTWITKVWTHCEQKWDDIKAPHIVTDAYHIYLLKINTTDEFKSFMPNTKYQVLVKPDDDSKFTRFHITVENENKSLPHGTLEIYDEEISEFSQDCPDAIIQVSQVAKDEISVYWSSPEEGSGCVIFRASIMESPYRWYMDGSLEQKFCQDPKATIDDPGPVLAKCCACNEAKYELAFEGLWTRYTHPKNFPSKPWSARFSDVIGASHTSEYRFWEYNGYASQGLSQVAENGLTQILESELKNQSAHIRTIIKARGINFPNITSKTFAVFRVDQQHHLMSLVSMIVPSPDWFVGVSGLELCLSNCSWIEHKELNLYPVDAGTDDGITYESEDSKTEPQDVIRRITTTWPEDERSPFYDETAIDMNPLAKLYLKRQRIYDKNCEKTPTIESSEGAQTHQPIKRKACRVTSWGQWESCSVSCGRGVKLRQRKYKNEKAASKHNCDAVLTDRVICYAENNFVCPPDEVDEKKCPMTSWSEWTPCSKSCGPESRTRSRNFRQKKRRKECKYLYPQVQLEQTLDCENPMCESAEGEELSAGGTESSAAADEETVSESAEVAETSEPTSDGAPTDESANTEPLAEEGSENADDLMGAENRQEVTDKKRRRKRCKNERYTQWSFWTPCSVTCGTGTKSRSRQIKPNWNDSPDVDKDLSFYECQYESTTCEAETKSCEITKELMEVICSQPEQPGYCPDEHNDNSLRYYYDKTVGKCVVFHYTGCNGNMNNFRTLQECQTTCDKYHEENVKENKKKRKKNRGETKSNILHNDKVDCKISEWGEWSPCYSCKGYRTMSRDILVYPRSGGKTCPSKLIRKQKCHKVLPECDLQNDKEEFERKSLDEIDSTEVSVHCRVSPWSSWSTCTATCGISQRRRERNIAIIPRGPHGKLCPPLAEIENCRVPPC